MGRLCNAQNHSGHTALAYAAAFNNTAIARALIAADPSVDHIRMQDKEGCTALIRGESRV